MRSFWSNFENELRDKIIYIPDILVKVFLFTFEVRWGRWRSKEVILVKILKLTQRYDILHTYSYDATENDR